jgi:uncharacterized phiE125 gp8 family phage protein
MAMTLSVITPPTSGMEVVTLAQAKAHLKVTSTLDDTYISMLIPVARMLMEAESGRKFLTTTLQLTMDQFPWNYYEWIRMYYSPVTAVLSVSYLSAEPLTDTNDYEWITYDNNTDLFIELGTPGRIARNAGFWGISNIYTTAAVRVIYQAGFTSDPNNVPPAYQEMFQVAQLATLWQLQSMYDNRSPISPDKSFEVCGPAQQLLRRLDSGVYAPTTQ